MVSAPLPQRPPGDTKRHKEEGDQDRVPDQEPQADCRQESQGRRHPGATEQGKAGAEEAGKRCPPGGLSARRRR